MRLAAAVATTLLLVEMASAYVSGSASAFLLRSRNPQVCSERVRVLFAGGGLRMPLAQHTLGRTRALHHTHFASQPTQTAQRLVCKPVLAHKKMKPMWAASSLLKARTHGMLRTGQAVKMALSPAHAGIAAWITENGGYVHPAVEPVDRGEAGIGLSLSAPVSAGQVLVALPPRLQVSVDELSGDEKVAVDNEVPPNKWDVKLGLTLLHIMHQPEETSVSEKKKEDKGKSKSTTPKMGFGAPQPAAPPQKRSSVKWKTYLSTLPSALPSIPIFFTGAQLREYEAEFPEVLGEAGGRVRLLKSVATAIPKEGAFKDLTLRKLAWAYSIVSSRSVRLLGICIHTHNV
jgi:hypothetical protein